MPCPFLKIEIVGVTKSFFERTYLPATLLYHMLEIRGYAFPLGDSGCIKYVLVKKCLYKQ